MMSLDFFKDTTNAILVRPNEIGKPILVKNIAYHPLINGHTLLFPTAGELLASPRLVAIRLCVGVCVISLLACSLLTRLVTPRIPTGMLILSSSSSVDP